VVQKLLFVGVKVDGKVSYFTPDVHNEENWFKLTLLAYVNL
jgi:hypothetical protein